MKMKKTQKTAVAKLSSGNLKYAKPTTRVVPQKHEFDLKNLKHLYDHAPIGCLCIDMSGGIASLNHSAAKMLGFDLERALGKKFSKHVNASDRPLFHDFFETVCQMGAAPPCEIRLNEGGGETVFVTLTGVRLPNENVCHVMATDITKLCHAQNELKRTRDDLESRIQKRTGKLRSLARELTLAEERERRRIAGLVHDNLQQLLVAVLLNIGATKAKNHHRGLLEQLENIEQMTKECVGITRSLAAELSPSVLHQCGLAAGFGWLRDWFADKYGFNVEVWADESLMPDEDISITLFQCVREIVFNAVKHSGVKSARLMMSYEHDAFVTISIRDEGVGFDAEALGLQDAWKGGFGLLSVRERVELLGGVMRVESSPGRGACFTLVFPAKILNGNHGENGHEKAPCEKVGQGHDESGEEIANVTMPLNLSRRDHDALPRFRVILADDHSMVRQGLVRVFQDEADFEVVGEAANGKEVVELARALHPDIIVMDLQMPVMSGLEATRAIRKALPAVRVIGLSMDESKEARRSFMRAGALDLLHKGGSAEDLIQRVREHLAAKV